MVRVRAAAHFSSSQFGTFTPGETLTLPADVANRYIQSGLVTVEHYESKPHIQTPSLPTVATVKTTTKIEATDLGADVSSTLSQPVAVSPSETVPILRRGRRRKTDAS